MVRVLAQKTLQNLYYFGKNLNVYKKGGVEGD